MTLNRVRPWTIGEIRAACHGVTARSVEATGAPRDTVRAPEEA